MLHVLQMVKVLLEGTAMKKIHQYSTQSLFSFGKNN